MKTHYRYLLYLVLLLPAFLLRDFTPDNELKYISIVEEALRNNTWFTFYNHREIYADKPPLYFWLIMLTKLLTGGYQTAFIGLFSLLPAIGVLAIMDKWLGQAGISHRPLVSNLMLLTTVMFAGAALVVRMDMLMTLFIVLSLYTFFRMYTGEHSKCDEWLLPLYLFLAIFSKGAMGLLIPVASMVAFLLVKKKFRTIGTYLGWKQWSILLGLCVVWFSLVYWEGGSAYLGNILFKQTVGRGVNSFHHKEPLWFYFPRMLWTFAPWVLLYGTLIWQGLRKRLITNDTEKFFLTIIVVNIMMLSFISAKLDIYMVPIYPFVVYLCAALLSRLESTLPIKVAIGIPAGVLTLVFPLSLFIQNRIPAQYSGLMFLSIALCMLSVCGGIALFMLYKKRIAPSILTLSFGILGALCVASFTLPQLNTYIGFKEMAKTAKQTAGEERITQYIYYKFDTASNMDVYLDAPLSCANSVEGIDSLLAPGTKGILFVRDTEMRRDSALSSWLENYQASWSKGRYSWYVIDRP